MPFAKHYQGNLIKQDGWDRHVERIEYMKKCKQYFCWVSWREETTCKSLAFVEDNTKMYLTEIGWVCEVHSTVSLSGGVCLHQLNDYKLMKRNLLHAAVFLNC
jgi:hypothetical protein